ncbi:protein-glutamate O-methyltransferase-like isoform X2 [Hyposmocoma kahamanoa]|uniref:protein-glutamate O-methyltransferase-like isoform X2 n=1 Tax=Hyposmocoma kahamanoa TaxID=1477025 RepID=UPI000E6DA3FC|nr:protein-glutamate O-methyltransferase-like isoform X2 [Hyposmocoma kahamanoa]
MAAKPAIPANTSANPVHTSEKPADTPAKPEPFKCHVNEDPDGNKPDFIYGGPFFVPLKKEDRLMDLNTPTNVAHSGTYKRSYAYHCLKERLPIILTKVIDYVNRTKPGAESQNYISNVSKLKYDLTTNKTFEHFTAKNEETEKWNRWIDELQYSTYFTNSFLWTECYVYRKLQEQCELYPSLANFDPFQEQKISAVTSGLEPMCIVAEKMPDMLNNTDEEQQKLDFITLLKLCLWANKCDMALTLGEPVNLIGADEETMAKKAIDPFQMIIDLKDKLSIDNSAKAYQNLKSKVPKTRAKMEKEEPEPPPPPPPPLEGEEMVLPPKIPCPAKLIVPSRIVYDIVCDNTGYELFTDLCFGTFLVKQELVEAVRFHVKKYPWFISDATMKDFNHLIEECSKASYSRVIPPPPPKEVKEGEEPPEPEEPRNISSEGVRELAATWKQYLEDGSFFVTDEDFWTYPHVYKDMQKIDPNLYRNFQFSTGILFKGDLNYRKLMGELNTNPYAKMLERLQGFNPAPIIACRTVKSEIICGMPKGKFELYTKLDPDWMKKGIYGVIQFCPKAEPFKPGTLPCIDYGKTCFSKECPVHKDF